MGKRQFDDKENVAENRATPVYGRGAFRGDLNLSEAVLPEESNLPDTVYEIIRNQVLLDARPELNLATFCNSTFTDPFGEKIVTDSIKKNFIDHTEYPGTNLSEARSITILARELGVEINDDDVPGDKFIGSATIGSSEAVMLGLIAHKFMWNMKQRVLLDWSDSPLKVDPRDRPVVLMSAHMHGCWDKFCRYYDAYPLYVEIPGPPFAVHDGEQIKNILETKIEDPESPHAAEIRKVMGYAEASQGDRTIGELVMCVGAVVGTTFTGNMDNISGIDNSVDNYCNDQNRKVEKFDEFEARYIEWYLKRFRPEDVKKWKKTPNDVHPLPRVPDFVEIPIHVDAAASAFVLMFSCDKDKPKFNFRDCPKRVRSMNISNHKYGMTFPGMGSVVFKDDKVVDPSLVYDIAYLGGNFTDYTVNFSRGSSMIVMQYYNFLRFGREGYRSIMDNCLENTRWFVNELQNHETLKHHLKNISNQSRENDSAGGTKIFIPTIVLTWKGKAPQTWTLTDLSHRLSQSGWSVPAYNIPVETPEDINGIEVLRIVVQQAVSREKLRMLRDAIVDAVTSFEENESLHEDASTGATNKTAAEIAASVVQKAAQGAVASAKKMKLPGHPGEPTRRQRRSRMC